MNGCYMTGIGDTSANTVDVDYSAIVTPLSSAVTNATVANVIFHRRVGYRSLIDPKSN